MENHSSDHSRVCLGKMGSLVYSSKLHARGLWNLGSHAIVAGTLL